MPGVRWEMKKTAVVVENVLIIPTGSNQSSRVTGILMQRRPLKVMRSLADKVCAAGFELSGNGLSVRLNRVLGYKKLGGDLFVGVTLSDELEEFEFTSCKELPRIGFGTVFQSRKLFLEKHIHLAKKDIKGADFVHNCPKVSSLFRTPFHLDRLSGQENTLDLRNQLFRILRELESVSTRENEIEDAEIRPVVFDSQEAFLNACGRGDDLDIGDCFQRYHEKLQKHELIFDDDAA